MLSLLSRLDDHAFARKAGLIDEASPFLTPRESEVAELLVRGLTNREIAALLFITQSTVKVHIRHVYEKLGVKNRATAIARLS